ncbi:Bug family tripartite tricarboxylate transporter substrate binding protein [Nesterenkonia xinjiangensis]|uniref:Tripartite-type tricarboxylate transporter receptor subunit TctC n=1 Tax=Nesterenkonia xinjiangensis TaxID=225327 RepID=A0A7Z0GL99_9MICC|nr:tripartite tricarboxylate transporter substrate binding protein [Nesterenkonia xinjiangensis]NYJ77221.1 tripartite-type tricarboxylate transporter receptor subunit TctC [Nesterenkonia xinjiangensis]
MSKTLRLGAATIAVSALGLTACGDDGDYPSEDITFVVPFGTGGANDQIARAFAQELESELGVNVNVENREGGGATIGTSHVINSDPDGYTIGLAPGAALAQQPLTNDDLPYSSPEDYHVVGKIAEMPGIVAVPGDSEFDDLEEFMSYAKDNPGELQASQAGNGTTQDLLIRELGRLADAEIQSIPLAGGGQEATLAAVSGRVDATFGFAPAIKGFVESDDLKVIGVVSDEQYEAFPEAQLSTDIGYDTPLRAVYYIVLPLETPEDVREQLETATESIVDSEAMAQFSEESGFVLDHRDHDAAVEEITEYTELYEEFNANFDIED